jgi:REP element-mobilizing transposase RayT
VGLGGDGGPEGMDRMVDRYTELYYHFIWATKGREPRITPDLQTHLYAYIRHKCDDLHVQVYALNGMPDHVHLACSLPTDLSIADFLEVVKGSSSHFINHLEGSDHRLYWQPGYGALTFAKRDLTRIVSYIDNQSTHHRDGELSPRMERDTD